MVVMTMVVVTALRTRRCSRTNKNRNTKKGK